MNTHDPIATLLLGLTGQSLAKVGTDNATDGLDDTETHHADWVVTTGPRRPLRRGLCPVGILAGMGKFTVTPQAEGEAASHHLALTLARRPFDEGAAASVGARLVGLVDMAEKQQTMEMVARLIAGVAGAQEAA